MVELEYMSNEVHPQNEIEANPLPGEWIDKALQDLDVKNFKEAFYELKILLSEYKLLTYTEVEKYHQIIDRIMSSLEQILELPVTDRDVVGERLNSIKVRVEEIKYVGEGSPEEVEKKSEMLRKVREKIGRIVAYFVLTLSDNNREDI